VGLQARTALHLVVLLLFSAVSASCQKPVEPAVDPLPPIDASDEVRAIQLEEQPGGQEVERVARSQAARELESTSKALAPAPLSDGRSESLDGGEPLAQGARSDELAGKLERATANQIIIRDSSGFAYWLTLGTPPT
jgi:hypothetical protein